MWQDDYFAVSVSESNVNIVANYIKNQETHHKRSSFEDEVKQFEKKFKFEVQIE